MSWTVLGALGRTGRARVDERGRVDPLDVSWSVDWLVGGGERWHQAASDAAVRQTLDGPAVAETRLRVPGGDVVHRTWVVPAPTGDTAVAVVEVENASPVAVVVGACVQPGVDGDGPTWIAVDGTEVTADGEVALRSSRAARAAVAGTGPGGARAVAVDDGAGSPPAAFHGDGSAAEAVALWPLPHQASLRMTIRLAPGGELPPPDHLPGPDAVTRGWVSHLGAGATASTGDPPVDRALHAWLHRLVLASEEHRPDAAEAALVAMALAEWGLTAFAVALLWDRIEAAPPETAGPLLAAAARLVDLGADDALTGHGLALAARAASELGGAVRRSRRRRPAPLCPPWPAGASDAEAWTAVWAELGLRGAARLAELDGQADASAALARAAARRAGGDPYCDDPAHLLHAVVGSARSGAPRPASGRSYLALAGVAAAGADRREALGAAMGGAPAGNDDPSTAAMLALLVRRTLVEETDGRLDVLPAPLAGRGVPVEAFGLPTVHGRFGFALRWHGDRPALLWELDGGGPVSIGASALDRGFASALRRGEVLLSEPD